MAWSRRTYNPKKNTVMAKQKATMKSSSAFQKIDSESVILIMRKCKDDENNSENEDKGNFK